MKLQYTFIDVYVVGNDIVLLQKCCSNKQLFWIAAIFNIRYYSTYINKINLLLFNVGSGRHLGLFIWVFYMFFIEMADSVLCMDKYL